MGLINQTQVNYYTNGDHGDYQFTSLEDVINNFMFAYVGEDKIIPKARRVDVAFHAQRALAELSFDTLKSCKAQEITVPASLQMTLPQDYVNYTKVSWVDSAGIKHLLYPTSKTSNPSLNPLQDSVGDFVLQATSRDSADGDNDIMLDKEYNDIIVGMLVSGAWIPPGATVRHTHNYGGFTTLFLTDPTTGNQLVLNQPSATGSIDTGNSTLTFSNPDGSLVLPRKSSQVINSLIFNSAYPTITAASGVTLDTTNLEVGMIVSNRYFPTGTVITHINDNSIVVNNLPTTSTAGLTAGLAEQINFVSVDKVDTDTWSNYKSGTPSENQDDYQDDTYWPMEGSRYGLDPQHAQANGSFYIDCQSGKIHFSSNISGKTVILDYISDSLGTEPEMQVHKFAEEAMYRWISHAIIAGRANVPEYQVNRFKKERFAAVRTAKLRLSSLKLEELTQILRGKSKWIKH